METPTVVWLYGDIFCPWTRQVLARIRELEAVHEGAVELGWRPLPLRPEHEAALRAVEFARDLDAKLADRVLDGLCEAAALGGLSAVDPATVLEVSEKLGLDPEGLRHAVSDGRYDGELARAEEEAERYAIDSVPTLLIGRRKIVGAAPAELLKSEVEGLLATALDAGDAD
ncbi:MAG: DsbA family protein [marine benthic group bacterium]|nr:DsbA family protein [Gemmatimonadota bacterium]MCL7965986.1 DsbA family protein [Gemmatimonadota bacterium]